MDLKAAGRCAGVALAGMCSRGVGGVCGGMAALCAVGLPRMRLWLAAAWGGAEACEVAALGAVIAPSAGMLQRFTLRPGMWRRPWPSAACLCLGHLK